LEGIAALSTKQTGAGNSAGYYMAGLAKWAASTDIRPNNTVDLPTLGGGTKQTVKTFVIDVEETGDCGYQSQYWLAAKYGDPASYTNSGAWLTVGNPWSSTLTLPAYGCASRAPSGYTNAAGGNVTWPKGLLRAADPAGMISAVQSAFQSITADIGDEAALAQSSGSLNTGTGAYIYQAKYNSGGWKGTIEAYAIDSSGVNGTVPAWSASTVLPAHGSRNILTFNDGQTSAGVVTHTSRAGLAFSSANLTSLSPGQQDALNYSEVGTLDNWGADRINYLRGDQSNEDPSGHKWRVRTAGSLIGDTIHSSPVYVGPPLGLQPGHGYYTYANARQSRKPMLYVGANDGMLHGYDASYTISATGAPVVTANSGKELVAYVPSVVYKKLNQLMSLNYGHQYYVDGSPVVTEAYFGGAFSAAVEASNPENCWKTLLVGGLNAGGQGLYALDVTDPTSLGASKVLWEFTDADDADLGYTFSRPIVRKINMGTKDRWAVIFGNGYNNSDPDLHTSATGRAYLYVLAVEGPDTSTKKWILNTNYWKIELKSPSEPASPTLPLSPPNGLSAVTGVDNDQNGTVDYIYAGDRNGNVWKIDLSDTNPTNWKSAFGTVSAPKPLFSATDGLATPTAQQITTSIAVQRHSSGGFLVMFGTGSWIDQTDPLGPYKTQSFYGIWDAPASALQYAATYPVPRSSLQKQKALTYLKANGSACSAGDSGCYLIQSNCSENYAASDSVATNQTTTCPSDIASPAGTHQRLGWAFDMPGSGERVFSDKPKQVGSTVAFTSLQPASDPCTGNTIGMEYYFDWLTGGAPTEMVYILAGSTSGQIVSSVYGTVMPGGTTIEGGAADTGITFSATPPPPGGAPTSLEETLAKVCGSSNFPASACSGSACSSYVPGWGFSWEQKGGTSAAKGCVVDCKPGQTGGALNCTWKVDSSGAGRISWRQMTQ
jgi:type IV pilus assembly protein PilY1